MAKETIYIEADDEITNVIDRVVSAKETVVAVVLPKRSTVFQSVVNMKLLKKVAKDEKKQVVLISAEPVISSIAAVAGMHVAESLNSKPLIPKKAKPQKQETTIRPDELEPTKAPESSTAVESQEGESDADANETIELDNTSTEAKELAAGTLASAKVGKKKMFKIPDFSSFRLRLTLGIVAFIGIVVAWFVGFVLLPQANVIINTDTTNITMGVDFTASVAENELQIDDAVVPAKKAEVIKENKVTVPATGEKDIGKKATGTVTMSAQLCDSIGTPEDVPAGTGVSASGKTYITQSSVSFTFSSFNGTCLLFNGESTAIVAQGSGESFNIGTGNDFTVSGRSDVSATGGASGGTTELIKVVSAKDIEDAKKQLSGTSSSEAENELKDKLTSQQMQPIVDTLKEGSPKVKTSAAVDAKANEVTVTQTTEYTMLGVAANDLGALLDKSIDDRLAEEQIDKNIRSNGLDTAVLRLVDDQSGDIKKLRLETIAVLGPTFDETALREEVRGKKRGDIERLLEARDGVRSVSVEYSPFWVTTTPKSAKKITITVNEIEN